MSVKTANRHVRRFAERNGLKTRMTEVGEQVVAIGPSKRNGAAWYAGRDEWAVYVETSKPGALCKRILKAVEARVLVRNGELEARVKESDLLALLDVSPLTRPRVKRTMKLSSERREALRRQMETINRNKRDSLGLAGGSGALEASGGPPGPPMTVSPPDPFATSFPDPKDGPSGPTPMPVE